MNRALWLLFALLCVSCATDRERARPASTPAPAGVAGASCEAQHGGEDSAVFLTNVRVGAQSGFDRITFEFGPREGMPAAIPVWTVEPAVPPLTQDGSGDEITVDGKAFLHIPIRATGVDLSGEEFREVYTGPKRFTPPPESRTLRELRHAGDFEGMVTWYAGLSRAACFKVSTLSNPLRLVVDVEH